MAVEKLLERELREAREREAEYRGRLDRHRELARKLRQHAASLREALRAGGGSRDIAALLTSVARLSGQALSVPRTGIWLFDEPRQHLMCRLQLIEGRECPGGRLVVAECPSYVTALSASEQGAVAVDDAARDPRTAQLRGYLAETGVGALLDIPIQGPGQLHGVLCHEHLGGPRSWQEDEIEFAAQVGALVAVALEAERRVAAERAARWTEAKYQHLVESLPVTVYSFQARTGQLDYLSPQIKTLGGREPDDYLVAGGVEHWVQAIEPDHREPVRKRLSGSIAEGFIDELVYPLRSSSGERRWVRDTCAVVRDARGRPFAIQGTLADITALTDAERAREELERRYRTLLESIDLLAVILDASGRVEFINDCFARVTGYRRDEALGADGFALILTESDRDRVRADFLQSMARGRLVPRFESNVRTRDGRNRRILWTNTLLRDSAGEVVGSSSVGVDLTERLEAETAQLESLKLESLGRLAATVAHDFNNLLSVMAEATDALEQGPDRAGGRARMDAAITQSAGLTRSLLAYARREAIAPTLLSLDELIAPVIPMLSTLVGPQLTLTHQLGAPQARVVIDPTQLRQVLINLVGNAADAARGHGKQVRVSTNLVLLETDEARARGLIAEGTFSVLTVSDDGRGMTPELVERAFDPFFTTKQKGEGTGLGLAMCASIVKRAGGFISVDTAPGQGAAFHVHLPVAEVRAPATIASSPPPAPRAEIGGRVVLVLEDTEAIRNLVTRMLSTRGLTVLEAPDLAAARKVLAATPVQVLLADGRLPDGDGISFAHEARANARVRRVILMSGSPVESAEDGIDAVVSKPFRPETLVETVLHLLDDQP